MRQYARDDDAYALFTCSNYHSPMSNDWFQVFTEVFFSTFIVLSNLHAHVMTRWRTNR